jgi:hypothetical protein
VGEKTRRFVGLEGVHPIAIARAHAIAVERIGYTPKRVRVGNTMEAPADTKYWRAVLAAIPAATLSAASEIKQCERAEQVMRDYEEKWIDEGNGDWWGD